MQKHQKWSNVLRIDGQNKIGIDSRVMNAADRIKFQGTNIRPHFNYNYNTAHQPLIYYTWELERLGLVPDYVILNLFQHKTLSNTSNYLTKSQITMWQVVVLVQAQITINIFSSNKWIELKM